MNKCIPGGKNLSYICFCLVSEGCGNDCIYYTWWGKEPFHMVDSRKFQATENTGERKTSGAGAGVVSLGGLLGGTC